MPSIYRKPARRGLGRLALLATVLGVLTLPLLTPLQADGADSGRTIVLGFDGMEPKLVEQWMADGSMPNFAKLAKDGTYQHLPTSNPAQSPVAWASFATGLNPGSHGIFDFLSRNPKTYGPDYSIATVESPDYVLEAFGYQLPLDAGSTRSKRVGTPFWMSVERAGQPATVLRVPVTFPPDPISHMLSGMGVPDLLGTQGTFTIYTTEPVTGETTGGRRVNVQDADRIETTFEGPPDPFLVKPTAMTVPMSIVKKGDRVEVTLDGVTTDLGTGQWSDWIKVEFSFGGFMDVSGQVRLLLVQGFPDLRLYVSPIQIDPNAPAVPISAPPEFAGELASRIGLFHTIGMPEETWSLNEEQISDDSYLDMVETILAEREAMFFDALERQKDGLVTMVFVQTDRVSHMFWRGVDPLHPLHESTTERGRGAIHWIYKEADRIVGKTLAQMGPNDRLIIISDHGFAPYRYSVNLNTWLAQNGFMSLKPGAPPSEQLFTNVNWTKTQAYAIALNDIYLNMKGREELGIVRPDEVAAIKQDIIKKLEAFVDPVTGERVVLRVYDAAEIYKGSSLTDSPDLVVGYAAGYRASWQTALGGVPEPLITSNDRKWSGDHLIDPSLVPGILFSSFKLESPVASIQAMPTFVRDLMGIDGALDRSELKGSVGFFDYPTPVLRAVDGVALGWLPVWARVVLWSVLASFLSMLIYRLTSRQQAMATIKQEIKEIREKLSGFDGELSELWPLLGRNLRLSGKHLALTFGPAMIASLPVIFVLAFMSNAFDAKVPNPGDPVTVQLQAGADQTLPPVSWSAPADATYDPGAQTWNVAWPKPDQPLVMYDSDGTRLLTLPVEGPVRTVAQREWFNTLIGNPGGYLPSPGAITAVHLGLPQPQMLPAGPDWLRGWLPLTLMIIVIASLYLKFRWRLH